MTDEQRIAASYKWLVITLLVIILDQVSKQAIVHSMQLYQRIELIPFFNLFYIHNDGAAFSFLSDQTGWQRWFLSAISLFISIGIFVWFRKVRATQRLLILSLVLVLGGAIGNLIDRVVFGYVVDFIDFYVGDWHFATFNIADSAVSIGAVLLILDTIKNPEKPKV